MEAAAWLAMMSDSFFGGCASLLRVASKSRRVPWLIAPLLFGACERDRTLPEELAKQTGDPPVPVGQGQSANLRAQAAGNVAGAPASPSSADAVLASGGFAATSNQLSTSAGTGGSGGWAGSR